MVELAGILMSKGTHASMPSEPKYRLVCTACSATYSSHQLKCAKDEALLRTVYGKRQIELKPGSGIGRFHDWLPVSDMIVSDAGPVTYKSTELAKELQLTNLYISFNGYWPEKRAFMKTCSFKELEAIPTLERFRGSDHPLVVASSGNTGRAFAHVATMIGAEVFIVVPESGMPRMWLPEEPADIVHVIEMSGDCDYADSIHFSERLASLPGMILEGGARNVARRDGMGTVMLDAAIRMRRMPDHYFQAVASGTGAIAAWEASLRLLGDGRFGRRLPRLHLSQNLPFAPMHSAWKAGRREIVESLDMPDPKGLIHEMYDDVLSNREPPYSVCGGVYDALSSTGGITYGITNNNVSKAKKLFENCEGIDILPSAGVAVASLIEATGDQKLGQRDYVLLNITGGGEKRLAVDNSLIRLKPEACVGNASAPINGFARRRHHQKVE
jgi:cysteate synthase